MNIFREAANFLFLLATVFLFGCMPAKAPREKVYWPPFDPKLEWIATIAGTHDFEKTEGEKMTDMLVGVTFSPGFSKPLGVAAGDDGLVYVSDYDAAMVRVMDFENRTISDYLPTAIGFPVGLVRDKRGFLYVADSGSKTVLVYDANRKGVATIGKGEFAKPTFLAINEELGRLYVTDTANNEVIVFDLNSGEKLFEFGRAGDEPGQFHGAQGIAIDKQGQVFVAEMHGARIQVFDADGQFAGKFGVRGDDPFAFEGLRGLAFDSQDRLFAVDGRKGTVMIMQKDGTPLTFLGQSKQKSRHALSFVLPTDVAIDANDRIYITDSLNQRVTVWQMLTPAYLANHPIDNKQLSRVQEKLRKSEQEKIPSLKE